MSSANANTQKRETFPEFELLAARARAAKIGIEFDPDGEDEELVLSFPNGRATRQVRIFETDDALALLAIDFENISFITDYEAVANYHAGELEAKIVPVGNRPTPLTGAWRIPGAEDLDMPSEVEDEREQREMEARRRFRGPKMWRLVVAKDGVEIEISPASDFFKALASGPVTSSPSLKIRGLSITTQDDAQRVLEEVVNSYLLDLDLRYQVGLTLARMRTPTVRVRRTVSRQAPDFPTNRYAQEPLALYFYGRSATGMPLLEFLAYYQVLEFYFPGFAQEDVARRVRAQLNDPRFDKNNDSYISRLISISAAAGKTSGPERDQLRTAIRACVDLEAVTAFIHRDDRTQDHFCRKNQSVSGLSPLRPQGGQGDLRDQIADRIYDIRCRVVHTKSDSAESGVELLLPSSHEARALMPDVDLVRFLAEQVLVNRAVPLRL